MIRDLQNDVSKLLDDLDSTASLRRLFERVLGYTREDYSVSRADWNPQTAGYAAEDPMLVATGGRNEQFHVLYTRLD